jgi:hypothetical protein
VRTLVSRRRQRAVRAGWGVWRERVCVQRRDTNGAARADRLLVRRNKRMQVCTKQGKGHTKKKGRSKKKNVRACPLFFFFFDGFRQPPMSLRRNMQVCT